MSTTPVVTPTSTLNLDALHPDQKQSLLNEAVKLVETDLKKQNAIEQARFQDALRKDNDIQLKKIASDFMEEERKKRKPLTQEELKTLLSQEYVEFDVKIKEIRTSQIYTFKICELPQRFEEEFYNIAQKTIVELVQSYSGKDLKFADGDMMEKILSLMQVFEPVFVTMVKACKIALNPYNTDDLKFVTEEWIRNNLTSYRIYTIVLAQTEVNKLRDFFSLVFQGFQSSELKNPADVQS